LLRDISTEQNRDIVEIRFTPRRESDVSEFPIKDLAVFRESYKIGVATLVDLGNP
jgi:hypothetical protein